VFRRRARTFALREPPSGLDLTGRQPLAVFLANHLARGVTSGFGHAGVGRVVKLAAPDPGEPEGVSGSIEEAGGSVGSQASRVPQLLPVRETAVGDPVAHDDHDDERQRPPNTGLGALGASRGGWA
jgi:hypothetical protein